MKITIPLKKPEVKLRKLQDLKGDGKFCCENIPLLNIELDHIIPDELHFDVEDYRCADRGCG